MSTSDFSDSDMDVDPLDEQFTEAAEHLQKIHNTLESTDLLEIYGYYKQATCGRCNTQKPSVFNMQSRSKWCAWNELGEMPPEEAKRLYIEKLKKVDNNWQPKEERADKKHFAAGWVVHSIPQRPAEIDQKAEHEKNVFDYIKEGNLIKLQQTLTTESTKLLDENGMAMIHWATDRNALDILKHLIELGADVNFQDSEQQTALHYAASCGHVECIRILLDAKADLSIKDADGQTCLDVAHDADILNCLKLLSDTS